MQDQDFKMTESQESDILPADHIDLILEDPQVTNMMDTMQDWSSVSIPEINAANPTGELPATSVWPGPHFFDTAVDFSGNHKKHYVLSTILNKLYVDIGKVVPFQIKWDGSPELYVRAMLMFTQADNLKNPVKRCPTHRDKDDPSNCKYDHADHVLASENDSAKYEVDASSQRHSIVVPLHLQQGAGYQLLNLKFMCKTSCTGGLNRSHTDIIFTLEDGARSVLGRQKLGIKICSCPKRDKDKDENNAHDSSGKKRPLKVKKEEKVEQKRIKIEPDSPGYNYGSTSFMVTAASPELAALAKDHLCKWNEVKKVEMRWPPSENLISITEHIAILPQPYNNI